MERKGAIRLFYQDDGPKVWPSATVLRVTLFQSPVFVNTVLPRLYKVSEQFYEST